MSSNYWIKLYIEILNDPKMARLSDRLFRRTIELFLLAGAQGLDGLLPSPQDMAWQLRISLQKLNADLEALKQVEILDYSDGSWNVVNFKSRQSPVDNNERVKRHRDMKKVNQYHQSGNDDATKRYTTTSNICNEDVTKRYTDTDTETETDKETNKETETQEKQKEEAAIIEIYENEIGPLTRIIADDIRSALEDYPSEWFQSAFQESAMQNKRSWKYALAILKRWKVEGFQSNSKPKEPAKEGRQMVLGNRPASGSYEAWKTKGVEAQNE